MTGSGVRVVAGFAVGAAWYMTLGTQWMAAIGKTRDAAMSNVSSIASDTASAMVERLTGKGASSYREQNNVPLIVAHPAFAGGKRCQAVTTHLDLAPTLVSLSNASPDKKAAIAKDLPGKDFSPVLAAPELAGLYKLGFG